ncbi:MAG: DNA primase [SAR324 cluster bacterium]|nr:DNA primase [SAR324 cluster bacterium]
MKVDRHQVREIVDRTDILQLIQDKGVALKRSGSSFMGLCPFHSEKSPSFSVHPQKGFFHCFGCSASGDAIEFLKKHDRLTFMEAVKELADRAGITLELSQEASSNQDHGFRCLGLTAEFYRNQLQLPQGDNARQYLQSRQVSEALQQHFMLGYAPSGWQTLIQHLQTNKIQPQDMLQTGIAKTSPKGGGNYDYFRDRLIFPIRDIKGRCIGFGGRIMGPDPKQAKYLNSPDSRYYNKSQVLYGVFEGLESIRQKKEMIFVEGYMDVIRMHAFGYTHAVGICGTALTSEHLRMIQRYVDKITVLLDGDQAGKNAALRSMPLLLASPLRTRVVVLPDQEDPDSFLLKYDKSALDRLLDQAEPALDFLVQQTLAKHGMDVQGRTRALEELVPVMNQIPHELARQNALVGLAERLKISVQSIMKRSEPLQSEKNYGSVPGLSSQEEDLTEKRLLHALLSERSLIHVARQHLKPSEFQTTVFQSIYTELLNLPEQQFLEQSIQSFEKMIPKLYSKLLEVYLENFLKENPEAQFRKDLRNMKERPLRKLYDIRINSADVVERLSARKDLEEQLQKLNELFPSR